LDTVAHTEAVEGGLDLLIEKRHARRVKETGRERDEEAAWRESERRYQAARRNRNRWEWVRHFDRMADSHAALAEEYRRQADELTEGAAYTDPGY
jgi:hypothetical protein